MINSEVERNMNLHQRAQSNKEAKRLNSSLTTAQIKSMQDEAVSRQVPTIDEAVEPTHESIDLQVPTADSVAVG